MNWPSRTLQLIRLVGACAIVLPASACGGSGTQAGDRGRVLRSTLQTLVEGQGSPPGAVGLVQVYGGRASAAAGVASLQPRRPMKPADRFRVGSVTKTFVAALTLSLAAEGKLSLSDTVARWLPGAFPYGSRITIRQLLNHTSGLYDFTQDPRVEARVQAQIATIHAGRSTHGTDLSPRAVVRIAASHPLDFSPGSDWNYSNTGYVVLGLIDEKAAGEPLAAGLRRRIFKPLRLHQTTFAPGSEIPGPHATGYLIQPGGRQMWPADTTPPGGWAASAIVSNTADLARFFSALLGGQLLPARRMREMLTTVSTHTRTTTAARRRTASASSASRWPAGRPGDTRAVSPASSSTF